MNPSPIELEKLLNVEFSEAFCKFWEAHVPNKTPDFSVQASKLGEDWGRRGYDPTSRQGIIEIEESLNSFHKELSLTHEILHLVLEQEGYPVVRHKELQTTKRLQGEWAIAANLHSVITHPVIWFRMRQYGFPVDAHIKDKAIGRLTNLKSLIDKYPPRRNFPSWCLWLLQYVLARLEWGAPERQMIYEMFASHSVPIGEQGEKYVTRLDKLGYFNPESLTPAIAKKAGDMFLQRLGLELYYKLDHLEKLTR